MFIIDAHLDLAMNALEWNRDLTRPVKEIRAREAGLSDKPDRGNGMVSLPALRKGNIGLVVATQIARYAAPGNKLSGWHSATQAWAHTQGQLAWYKAMEDAGEMIQIHNNATLQAHLALWHDGNPNNKKPVGYILSLEGADSILTPDYLDRAFQYGLRAIGPAHYGPGRYANGTNATGNMGEAGLALLKKMQELNLILDATHLCDDAFWQAMDCYQGPVWASHNNCRALVDHQRQFSDEQIKTLIAKDAVIGVAFDAWMIVPGWQRGIATPVNMQCNLAKIVDHIDHICQLAGDTLHAGIGTDLDGAFGKEQCPYDIDSIEDLQNINGVLASRGYSQHQIEDILYSNFIRLLTNAWA